MVSPGAQDTSPEPPAHEVRPREPVPTISVVIPTTGRRATVRASVESVLNSCPEAEVVVAVDGEDHLQRVVGFLGGLPVRLVAGKRAGVSATRNLGFSASTGRWVGFLDDDDVLMPGWLPRVKSSLTAEGRIVLGTAVFEQEHEASASHLTRAQDPHVALLSGTFLVRRETFEAAGGYDRDLAFSENTDLALRLSSLLGPYGEAVIELPETAVRMRRQSAGQRLARYGLARAQAAELVMDRHASRFAASPTAFASWSRVVSYGYRGVDRGRAFRAAWAAARREPGNGANWRSLVLAILPSVQGIDAHRRQMRREPPQTSP